MADYIPTISSSIIQDLDRSLRSTLKNLAHEKNVAADDFRSQRDITSSVHAVERAASLLSSTAARVRDLIKTSESDAVERAKLLAERDQLASQCAVLTQDLALERDRQEACKALIKEHEANAQILTNDLAEANSNIDRLTAVIAKAFGSMESAKEEASRGAVSKAQNA